MAISSSIRIPLERRTAVRIRLPLSTVIPAVDAAGLCLANAVARPADRLGVAYAVVAFAILAATGAHGARVNPRLEDDAAPIVGRLAVAILLVAPLAGSQAKLVDSVRLAAAATALVLMGRFLSYKAIRAVRAGGFVFERTLVVGAGQQGVQLVKTLEAHPEFGLAPVGFLDSFEDRGLPAPILGSVRDLEAVVDRFRVTRIVIAFGAVREPEMVPIIRACDRLPVEVYVMPRFFELGMPKQGAFADDVWGIPLLRLRRSALRTMAWRTKRAFDLVVGSIVLVMALPVLAAAALAVRVSTPGPIFFRQKRVGQRGEVFELLKFRTMYVNDDSDTKWNVADDTRVTTVGRILRKTGIDELPQIFNVLKGEMSLVGPRPERPYFVDQFRIAVPGYEERHRVPVGITGWAQVHGLRGDTSIEERAVFDNSYVENWSLWRDAVILVRTFRSLVLGTGT